MPGTFDPWGHELVMTQQLNNKKKDGKAWHFLLTAVIWEKRGELSHISTLPHCVHPLRWEGVPVISHLWVCNNLLGKCKIQIDRYPKMDCAGRISQIQCLLENLIWCPRQKGNSPCLCTMAYLSTYALQDLTFSMYCQAQSLITPVVPGTSISA